MVDVHSYFLIGFGIVCLAGLVGYAFTFLFKFVSKTE